jgi:hypothetical protein
MTPGLRASEQLDDVTIAHASTLRRLEAEYAFNERLLASLGPMMEPEHRRQAEAALAVIGAPYDEHEQRILDRAERSRTRGKDALEQWQAEQDRKKRAEPWIDPAGGFGRGGFPQQGHVEIDEDGRVWGQSGVGVDDTDARIETIAQATSRRR